MQNIIIIAIIVILTGISIRKMIRDKKNGKSCHCSGDCGNCGRNCR